MIDERFMGTRVGAERWDMSPEQPRDEHGRFTGGGLGLETNDKGKGTESPTRHDHEVDGLLYHITYAKHLASIAAKGLDPNHGGSTKGIGANAGLSEHSRKSVFVTEAKGANFWRGRLEDHANDRSDDPRKDRLTPVTLRINQSLDVHHDHLGTADANAAAMMVRERIEPKNIEFFANGAWHPIAEHATLDHRASYDEDGYLKQDHDNPLAPHFDTFEVVCDFRTRFDFSPDQPRDDHGRFGTGVMGLEKTTGAGSERAGAKDMSQLAEQLKNLHSGTKDSFGREIRDDWGVSVFERERFATPVRTAVLEHFKDIVENATGIKQTIPIQELRIDQLNGAKGTMTPAHVETVRNYERDENDNALPDHVMQMASRITITPDQHVAAIGALETLGANKVPTHEQIGGLHTYIHEMCHTTSPMQLSGAKAPDGTPYPSAYRAHGAVIEEVTTEVMARGVMAKLLAYNEERGHIMSPHSQISENRAGARSSYQPAINWTLNKIKEATVNATPHGVGLGEAGIERGRAIVALREATQAYRAMRPPTPFNRDQAAAQFAIHVGHAVVKAHPDAEIHAGEVAEAVRLQLRQIEGGPDSDILQRFDAKTMTRFDAPQLSVWTVPRNDVEAAMAISNPSPDEMGVLLMLQDNPETLLQAIAKRSR